MTESDRFHSIRLACDCGPGSNKLSEADKPRRVGDGRALERELQAIFDDCGRSGRVVSIAVLDLAGLREVNAHNGWQRGDEVIQGFGDFLTQSIEGSQSCWHIGGDAFLVAAPGLRASELQLCISALRESLEQLPENQGPGATRFVEGLAQFPDDGPSVRMVVRAADRRKEGKSAV